MRLDEVTLSGDCAVAEYERLNGPGRQIAFDPIRAELRRDGTGWTVETREFNPPWWWEIVNRTVGVK